MKSKYRYKNAKEMEVLIDEYFKECEGIPCTNENGQPVTTDAGAIVYKTPPKPPTVRGMAMSLLNYRDKLYI